MKGYFFKALISMIVFFILVFFYMNNNIKNAKLNKDFSKIVRASIELEDNIKLLEVKYNNLIRNQYLEEKALNNFNMNMPQGEKIIRIKE